MKLSEKIQKTHDFLAVNKWGRHWLFMNAKGERVEEEGACRFCVMGAFICANGSKDKTAERELSDAFRDAVGPNPVVFNDHHAHDKRDVLRKLRIVKRYVEKKEAA